jgi:hypothetical protein
MTGPEGIDSPSRIATLLIWQQPHIIYMLELVRAAKANEQEAADTASAILPFMRRYFNLVRETAEFICDFLTLDPRTGSYNLTPPLIPAQEEHAPLDVLNPVFELSYWRYGLSIAIDWAESIGEDCGEWKRIRDSIAKPQVINGLYPAHENCPDTFTRFNRDHPSMLYACGFIPDELIDRKAMSDTADAVEKCWDKQTLWGWDFALTAMTYTRLGRPEAAIDTLLSDTAKNSYTVSGNNFQRGRDDLPLYLPGNGSLLFALPMMLKEGGFPDNGQWDGIRYENL